MADGVDREFSDRVVARLIQDTPNIGFDRVLAIEHRFGDLFAAIAFADVAEHFHLFWREVEKETIFIRDLLGGENRIAAIG